MVTPATIKEMFPEFASLANGRIQLFIDLAATQMNETQWGSKYDPGWTMLSAHYLEVGTSEGGLASGPATARRAGDVAESYSVSDIAKESAYGSTSYGRIFLEMQEKVFPSRCI